MTERKRKTKIIVSARFDEGKKKAVVEYPDENQPQPVFFCPDCGEPATPDHSCPA